MPEFDYRAVDGNGNSTSGRMVAGSANDVVARLSQQGLIIQGLQMISGGGVAHTSIPGRTLQPIVQGGQNAITPPVIHPMSQNVAQPMRQPMPALNNQVAPQSTNQYQYQGTPAILNKVDQKFTGFFKDYDLWMLLSQMGTILRAGISPTQMLEELSHRASIKPKAKRAMADMAKFTGLGHSLADAMAVYPEIFPEGVVGSTRAGEAGGYLPDALQHTSAQIQASWKVRRHYLWTALAIYSTVIMLPMIPVFNGGSEALGRVINGGETTSQAVLDQYFGGFLHALMGWPLVALILMTAAYLFGPYVTGRIWFLPLRHAAAARLPIIGRRTRMESSRELSFHLEHLSVAGISPYRSFGLAAGAVPNKVYRDDLMEAARPMREDMPISQVLPRHLIPDDLVDLVRTGEMTGTTHEAFQQIERLAAGDQANVEAFLKVKAWVWVGLFVFGFSSIIAAVMMSQFYGVMFKAIMEGT
jgi:general secretion pathway protein F